MPVQLFRSMLFHGAFYLTTAAYLLVCLPLLFLPRRFVMVALAAYGRTCLWLLKIIVGLKIELRGHENLHDGACIIAAKHQSAWETFALFPYLKDPIIIMKAELFWIPVHGWFALKFRMIPARRGRGRAAIAEMLQAARARIGTRREIIIFPEGTRRPIGAEPVYRNGVVALYEGLGIPCCPVALNSGLFWRRRRLLIHPGTVILSFLPPIPPGLDGRTFKSKLVHELEQATCRLIRETLARPDAPPVPPDIRARFLPKDATTSQHSTS